MGEPAPVICHAIRKRAENTFTVDHIDGLGGRSATDVYAKDELDAFVQVSKQVREDRVTTRFAIVGITLVILSMLSALTYSCNTPDPDLVVCVKAGRAYTPGAPNGSGKSCQ